MEIKMGHILSSPVTTNPPRDAKGIGFALVAVRIKFASFFV
jgi:hypothetical protein